MKTIAFYHLKGGVGKTAAAVNIAYLAAQHQIPTLLWDMDPQGSATWHFSAKPSSKVKVGKLLSGKSPIGKLIKKTEYPNLDIIPADLTFRNFDVKVDKLNADGFIKNWLEALSEDYGLVIIDCAPSLSNVSENIFLAADHIYTPVIPAHLSLQTLQKLIEFIDSKKLKKLRLRPFFSMVDRRKRLHKEFIDHPPKLMKNRLKGYIPYASSLEQMGLHQKPVFEFADKSPAALAFKLMWEEIRADLGI